MHWICPREIAFLCRRSRANEILPEIFVYYSKNQIVCAYGVYRKASRCTAIDGGRRMGRKVAETIESTRDNNRTCRLV